MKITAHSGCDNTPMNSPEYLQHALALDCDAIEIDVRSAANGELILTHDPQSKDDTIFTLREAFGMAVFEKCAINCDLKEYQLESSVIRTANALGIARERIIFSGSVTPHPARQWPDYMQGVQVYMNIEELVPEIYKRLRSASNEVAVIQEALDLCAEKGCTVINVDFHICTPTFLQMCKERGLKISVWTVTEEEEIKKALSMNVFNITTCAPETVRRLSKQTDFDVR